jgi:NIPSNAP
MSMFQLRIYTLSSVTALEQYAGIHWTRHIPSLEAFGVTTHGIWTERDGDVPRLIALISYPDGADPTRLTSDYLASPEFAADMAGFDPRDIIDVESILLDATESSPIQARRSS